eukprot:scaffold190022_cov35-Tisochrysis_lutea.AAC.2
MLPCIASMACCAISWVANRMKAQAMPERDPPRMMKTSSTAPCFSKICRQRERCAEEVAHTV